MVSSIRSFLLVVAAITTSLTPLPGAAAGAVVPAEEVVAFHRPSAGSRDIFLVTPDGLPVGNLTASPSTRDVDPSWAPSGHRIAFARRRPGSVHEIHTIAPTGESLRRLTASGFDDREPAWSPSGERIAFVRSRPARGWSRLMTMSSAGSTVASLTSARRGRFDASPSWSPDGTALVFARSDGGFPSLWVVQADGSGLRRLTSEGCSDANPSWGAAGIVFDRTCGGGAADLWIVDAAGGSPLNLTSTPGVAELDPDWSPGGEGIAHLTQTPGSGGVDLAVRMPWTSPGTVVAAGGASEVGPDWHRLGRVGGRPCT
ncbi:MAG TPA: hypothetical protein VM638_01290, partial [Actinomycetota bacterium]|nr:hypothetical protein [Actinomycetota bacterium]